jgi:uncharacterized protein (DUF39 family)
MIIIEFKIVKMTENNEYNNEDITMEIQNGYEGISMQLQDNSDYEDETDGHDEDECDSSGHCYECCKLSKCTTKDTWVRQGQYECNKGMYFPCTICEPQFKGIPQTI